MYFVFHSFILNFTIQIFTYTIIKAFGVNALSFCIILHFLCCMQENRFHNRLKLNTCFYVFKLYFAPFFSLHPFSWNTLCKNHSTHLTDVIGKQTMFYQHHSFFLHLFETFFRIEYKNSFCNSKIHLYRTHKLPSEKLGNWNWRKNR